MLSPDDRDAILEMVERCDAIALPAGRGHARDIDSVSLIRAALEGGDDSLPADVETGLEDICTAMDATRATARQILMTPRRSWQSTVFRLTWNVILPVVGLFSTLQAVAEHGRATERIERSNEQRWNDNTELLIESGMLAPEELEAIRESVLNAERFSH